MNSDEILKRLDSIDEIPTLPIFVNTVCNMVDENKEVDARELSRLIEKDQAMASKIIRFANQGFFGIRLETSNVSHAVAYLGNNMVRDAVVSIAIVDLFSTVNMFKGFNIKGFWIHSISVAMIARYVAKESEIAPPDMSFMGGLLHDIGKVALCVYFPEYFEKVWQLLQNGEMTFYEAEKKEIPTNHSEIGTALAKIWKLPRYLIDVIQGHHKIEENMHSYNLSKIVHLSDVIVNRFAASPDGEIGPYLLDPVVEKELAHYIETAPEWQPRISNEIHEACAIFLN